MVNSQFSKKKISEKIRSTTFEGIKRFQISILGMKLEPGTFFDIRETCRNLADIAGNTDTWRIILVTKNSFLGSGPRGTMPYRMQGIFCPSVHTNIHTSSQEALVPRPGFGG